MEIKGSWLKSISFLVIVLLLIPKGRWETQLGMRVRSINRPLSVNVHKYVCEAPGGSWQHGVTDLIDPEFV